MANIGTDARSIRASLRAALDRNADLLIGIDDPEIVQLIDVLVDAVAETIAENNSEIASAIESASQEAGFRLRI